MIKMLRDAHDDNGAVLYRAGEIVCATPEEEDVLVRRNYADWEPLPDGFLDCVNIPVDTANAAVEGADE